MILVVDSGSTKTDWCLVDAAGEKRLFQTLGMNPYIISEDKISEEIKHCLKPHFDLDLVEAVFFYGAGCSTPEKISFMSNALQAEFKKAAIDVEHDLLGAARALCKKEAGIAGILGTGSNSCLYDGEKIVENIPSLGYILCDEGAGSYIGKLVLKSYLQFQFSEELHNAFSKKYPGSESELLDRIYKAPLPNRFLASLAPFALEHKENSQIKAILNEAFGDFFEKQIMGYTNYKQYKIHLVGSIASHFHEIIKQKAATYGLQIGHIIKAPLNELVAFHSKH